MSLTSWFQSDLIHLWCSPLSHGENLSPLLYPYQIKNLCSCPRRVPDDLCHRLFWMLLKIILWDLHSSVRDGSNCLSKGKVTLDEVQWRCKAAGLRKSERSFIVNEELVVNAHARILKKGNAWEASGIKDDTPLTTHTHDSSGGHLTRKRSPCSRMTSATHWKPCVQGRSCNSLFVSLFPIYPFSFPSFDLPHTLPPRFLTFPILGQPFPPSLRSFFTSFIFLFLSCDRSLSFFTTLFLYVFLISKFLTIFYSFSLNFSFPFSSPDPLYFISWIPFTFFFNFYISSLHTIHLYILCFRFLAFIFFYISSALLGFYFHVFPFSLNFSLSLTSTSLAYHHCSFILSFIFRLASFTSYYFPIFHELFLLIGLPNILGNCSFHFYFLHFCYHLLLLVTIFFSPFPCICLSCNHGSIIFSKFNFVITFFLTFFIFLPYTRSIYISDIFALCSFLYPFDISQPSFHLFYPFFLNFSIFFLSICLSSNTFIYYRPVVFTSYYYFSFRSVCLMSSFSRILRILFVFSLTPNF